MANLVVTSSTNTIKVVFNDQPFFDQPHGLTFIKGTWKKDEIASIRLHANYVFVETKDGTDWKVSQDGATGTFTVDTVDGVAPTSTSDLYDKLVALIA